MASVRITVEMAKGDFSISMDCLETNGQAFGADMTHIDRTVDEAVARVKRAYWPTSDRTEKNDE